MAKEKIRKRYVASFSSSFGPELDWDRSFILFAWVPVVPDAIMDLYIFVLPYRMMNLEDVNK